jgi:hypothetical protein
MLEKPIKGQLEIEFPPREDMDTEPETEENVPVDEEFLRKLAQASIL